MIIEESTTRRTTTAEIYSIHTRLNVALVTETGKNPVKTVNYVRLLLFAVRWAQP